MLGLGFRVLEDQVAKIIENTMLGFTGFRWVRGFRVYLLIVSGE